MPADKIWPVGHAEESPACPHPCEGEDGSGVSSPWSQHIMALLALVSLSLFNVPPPPLPHACLRSLDFRTFLWVMILSPALTVFPWGGHLSEGGHRTPSLRRGSLCLGVEDDGWSDVVVGGDGWVLVTWFCTQSSVWAWAAFPLTAAQEIGVLQAGVELQV